MKYMTVIRWFPIKRIAFIICCFYSLVAKADTFVVTSNADNGPGTLREALNLANANGTALIDYIHFNLADVSINGRTISLLSALPPVSSNLIIDGTTQPGAAFGISDSKIIIERLSTASSYFDGLVMKSVSNIAIYGLTLRNFLINPLVFTGAIGGIRMSNVSDIKIGDVGKGNVVKASGFGIINLYDRTSTADPYYQGINIVLKSNIIGLNEDGATIPSTPQIVGIFFWEPKDLQIGGVTAAEGNIISGNTNGGFHIFSQRTAGNGFIKVLNNKIGIDFTGTKVMMPMNYPAGVNMITSALSRSIDYDVEIRNNTISGFHTGLNVEDINKPITITGNSIGTVLPSNWNHSNETGIFVRECLKGVIGGDGMHRNTITNSRQKAILLADGNLGFNLITVSKNSIYCNGEKGISVQHLFYGRHPFVYINILTPNLVKGKAKPGSFVELFYDDNCPNCEGKTYITTVTAGADSIWSYSGAINGNVVATSTEPSGLTSEFSKPEALVHAHKITHATCNKINGSITGISIISGTGWRWEKTGGQIVSLDTSLTNVGAGSYWLVGSIGSNSCMTRYGPFEIKGYTPPLAVNNYTVQNASCGQNNGKINVQDYFPGFRVIWLNAAMDSVGNNYVQSGLLPGDYSLKLVAFNDADCFKTYGPFTVVNIKGPSVNTDGIIIKDARCGNADGSITGINTANVTGTPYVAWVDSAGKVAGNSLQLQNTPPGKYRLKFKDGSGCDTILTGFYTINNIGAIIIDSTRRLVTPAKCNGIGGSIQNYNISGGNKYEWSNVTTGIIAGNTVNVANLPPANYQLTVTNNTGCSETSSVITVPQSSFIPIGIRSLDITHTRCGKSTGSVSALFLIDTIGYGFRWADSTTNQTTGSYTRMSDKPAGTYLLFARDSNACEQQLEKATIIDLPPPSFDYSKMQVSADKCETGSGAISGILIENVTGSRRLWLDAAGDSIGNNINIQGLHQGQYQLKVIDASGCIGVSRPIILANNNVSLPDPQYNDLTILKNTSADLKLKSHRPGSYQLYHDISATVPVATNTTGNFTSGLLASDKVFYVRYIDGVCQSGRVAVKLTVIEKTAIYMPSAFTPNGDGKNDILKAIPYGRIKLLNFSLYNRWGQLVFTTNDFNTGWNGFVSGQPSPAATFIWILKAVDEITGLAINQKGTVMVIR